jgi:hypothetical protein
MSAAAPVGSERRHFGGPMSRAPNPRPPIVVTDGVARIPLTQGYFTLIDEADADMVLMHSWCVLDNGSSVYAARKTATSSVLMHRAILCVTDRRTQVDHVNRDSLDNRRANLRLATCRQNHFNSGATTRNRSGYKGVRKSHNCERWEARGTSADGQRVFLGMFASAEDAARAHDAFAVEEHGPFAALNFGR